MSHPVTQFAGSRLYLDTMIFYALLRDIEGTAPAFFQRIERGDFEAYTSVLTFDELIYRLLLALIRDQYGGSPLERLRNQESEMIQEFYPQIAPHMAHLRAFPYLFLIDFTSADLGRMNQNIEQYALRPRDALHLAAMQKVGCTDLASNDGDWDRVPHLARYTLP